MLSKTLVKCAKYAQCKTLVLLDLSGFYNPKFSAVKLYTSKAVNN